MVPCVLRDRRRAAGDAVRPHGVHGLLGTLDRQQLSDVQAAPRGPHASQSALTGGMAGIARGCTDCQVAGTPHRKSEGRYQRQHADSAHQRREPRHADSATQRREPRHADAGNWDLAELCIAAPARITITPRGAEGRARRRRNAWKRPSTQSPRRSTSGTDRAWRPANTRETVVPRPHPPGWVTVAPGDVPAAA